MGPRLAAFVRTRATAHHGHRQERRAREKHPCPDVARSGFVRPATGSVPGGLS